MDWGALGAAVVAGGEGGFLLGAGACAQAVQDATTDTIIAREKADRARKGMRLDESSAERIPRRSERHKSRFVTRGPEVVGQVVEFHQLKENVPSGPRLPCICFEA